MAMKNFPFEHEGKTYWYSRSLACALLVFGKDKFGDLYILVSKRGKGCEYLPGKWNVSGGFIDFGENAAECATRECYEETGVSIEPSEIKFHSLNTEPIGARQTMVARFHYFMPTKIENIETTNEHSEPDEVAEIRWMRCNDEEDIEYMSRSFEWARDQIKYIREISKIYRARKFSLKYMLLRFLCTVCRQSKKNSFA